MTSGFLEKLFRNTVEVSNVINGPKSNEGPKCNNFQP